MKLISAPEDAFFFFGPDLRLNASCLGLCNSIASFPVLIFSIETRRARRIPHRVLTFFMHHSALFL